MVVTAAVLTAALYTLNRHVGWLEELDVGPSGVQNPSRRQVFRHHRANDGHHTFYVRTRVTSGCSENGEQFLCFSHYNNCTGCQ